MKNLLNKIGSFIKNHYSSIFVVLLFIAIIVKEIFYIGMADNNYHFGFHFIYGLKHMGWHIILLMLTYIFLFSFALLFNNKGRYFWVFCIYVVSIGFIIGDLAYTRFFQGPASLFWRIMPHNSDNNVVMSIWVHYSPTDALWFIDSIIFIVMFIIGLKKKLFTYHTFRVVSKSGTIISSIFMVAFISILTSNSTINSLNSTNKAASYGNFMYHLIDIAQLPSYKDKEKLSDSDYKNYGDFETTIMRDEESSTDEWNLSSVMEDTNLIVIQLEAMESFVLGNQIEDSKGVWHEITPNINKLLNHSVQLNTVEQVHVGNSSDCDLLFMTGQYPVSKVITFNQYENSQYLSLAKVLSRYGYKTSYLNGAYNSTWNYTGVMDSTIGFDEAHFGDEIINNSDESKKYDIDYNVKKVCGYINDNSLLRYEEEILSKYSKDDKFYNHIVLCSSHIPYHLPSVLDEAFLNNDKKLKKEIGSYFYNYISLAHYVDSCIGRFLNNLDEKGVLDNTSIVVMGDHGGIHKYMSNRTKRNLEGKSKYDWTTKASNYTCLTVLYNKNINGHYVIGRNSENKYFNMDLYKPTHTKNLICGQIDTLPTLAYLMGIENGFYYEDSQYSTMRSLMGRNMLKTSYSFAIKSNYEIVGKIPSDASILRKGKYLSNQLIKSEYFGSKK